MVFVLRCKSLDIALFVRYHTADRIQLSGFLSLWSQAGRSSVCSRASDRRSLVTNLVRDCVCKRNERATLRELGVSGKHGGAVWSSGLSALNLSRLGGGSFARRAVWKL